MATEYSPQSDRDPDSDVSDLLQQTFCCDSPREEFVESLHDALAAELTKVTAASRNGKISGSEHLQSAAAPSSDDQRPEPLVVRSDARRRTRQSLAAVLTAAVVVTAVAIWGSRPTYSWMSVVRALEQQPWVESTTDAETETGTESSVRNWFSRVHRVVIRQSGEDLVWDDLQEGVRSRYRTGTDVLVQSQLATSEVPSVEQALLSFLLKAAGRLPGDVSEPLSGPIEVLRQSWQKRPEAQGGGIALDVVLRWGPASDDSMHLILDVDPDTHLPQLCRVVEADRPEVSMIRFEYPVAGPQQVYDLGVPRDVAIRHMDEAADPVRVAAAPAETPAIRVKTPTFPTEVNSRIIESEAPKPRAAGVVPSAGAGGPRIGQRIPKVPAVTLVVKSPAEMTRRIDELIAQLWERNGISPVGACSDLEFLRRVYLDLTGRVPTVSEVREFIRDVPDGRRERLVEQLLTRRDHATHLAAVWRRFLLPEGVDLAQYGGTASFEQWLTDRFRANAPYDEVVRELLLAEGRVSESGPILFYTALKLAPEALAAQTSRAFLGMRLECAQCHDHFFDHRWKQEDFWGYAAFFARISRPQGKMEMISPVLQVKDSNWGDVTLPEQESVIPPRYPLGATLSEDPEASSRRRELADWMTAPDNPHFGRATVNRVWAHLFGRGLVEPVDDMRSDHPPISPEVLDELAGNFIASGFDLRNLFRVIVLSETYQRSSGAADDDPARALHFAQMNIKSFTAEQLYDSIAVATRLEAPAAEDGSLMRTANVSRSAFIEQFRAPPGQQTDYQSGIPQALTLMNGGLIQGATGLKSSGILRSLEAPFFSDEQRVESLFLATLSRPPDDDEGKAMLEYATSSEGDRGERLGDILWALLNTAEFTLNH